MGLQETSLRMTLFTKGPKYYNLDLDARLLFLLAQFAALIEQAHGVG
jgi:hypothetical protein